MFGNIANKKQAVAMDLGPIAKELTKIEKNIGEQKENETSIRDMIKSINVSGGSGNSSTGVDEDIKTKINEIHSELLNKEYEWAGSFGILKESIYNIYSDLSCNADCLKNIIGAPGSMSESGYQYTIDYRIKKIYESFYESNTDRIFGKIDDLCNTICYGADNPFSMLCQDIYDIKNKINNNYPIETMSDKFIVVTGKKSEQVSKKRFIYFNMEVYKDYMKIKLLNTFHAQLIDRILVFNNTGYRDPVIGKFIEKYSSNLDISKEPDPTMDGESFSFELLTQTVSGKMQSITMEVSVYDHQFIFINFELDNSLEIDFVILPQEIIFPFKTPLTI